MVKSFQKVNKDPVVQQQYLNDQTYGKVVGESKKKLGKNPAIVGKDSNIQKRKIVRKQLRDLKESRMQMQDGTYDFLSAFKRVDCDLLENSIMFVYNLYRCRNIPDALVACTQFIKLTIKKNVTEVLALLLEYFQEQVVPFFQNIIQDGEMLGESFIDGMNILFKDADGIINSKVFKALQDFSLYVWCFLFDLIPIRDDSCTLFHNIHDKITDQKIEPGMSVAIKMTRSLFYLVGQGYQAVKADCPLAFFHTESSFTKWIQEVNNIPNLVMNLNSASSTRIAQPDLLRKLDTLIAQGIEMRLLLQGYEHNVIEKELTKLRLCRNEQFNSLLAMKTREAPLAILLFSEPDCGKSSFITILHAVFAQLRGLEKGEHSRYNRNFKEDFWSNFKSTMWCVILDDIANESKNMVSSLSDSSVGEILQIMNNIAYLPNMAKLEDKGNCICMPQLVIGSTNTASLNADHLYNNPYAILRRFPYIIKLRVKKEFQKQYSHGLDGKIVVPTGQLADLWEIAVTSPKPGQNALRTSYSKDITFGDIFEFCQWYRDAITEHFEIEKKIIANVSLMRDVTLCEKCFHTVDVCSCTQMQDGYAFDDAFGIRASQEYFIRVNAWLIDAGVTTVVKYIIFGLLRLFACVFMTGAIWNYNPVMCLIQIIFAGYYAYAKTRIFSYVFMWLANLILDHTPLNFKIKLYARIYNRMKVRIYGNSAELIEGLICLLSGLVATYVVINTGKKLLIKRTEALAPVEAQGGLITKETKNPYYNDIEPSVSVDFGRMCHSWKNLDVEKVLDKLDDNVVSLRCLDGTCKFGTGIYIGGQVVMTNYHLFSDRLHFVVTCKSGGLFKTNIELKVSKDDIITMPDRDLMFIRFRQLPAHRRITGLFPNAYLKDIRCKGTIMTRSVNGVLKLRENLCTFSGRKFVPHAETDRCYTTICYSIMDSTTESGDCGSPYVAWTSRGPCIVALHESKDTHAHGCCVFQSDLDEVLLKIGNCVQGGGLIRDTMPFEVAPLSKDSNLRRIEQPIGHLFGSTIHRFPSKSKVCKTIMFNDAIERGMIDDYSGPNMRGRKIWINQMSPILLKEFRLDLTLLDKAKAMYMREVNLVLTPEMLATVTVLSDDDSVNGIDGVDFIDKIIRHTSAGFPLNQCKKEYLTIDETTHRATVSKIIWDDVEELKSHYLAGERNLIVFMGSLKDEVLKKKKVLADLTRMFTGSPFSFTIIFRKYFLSLTALIQNNVELFESYPGTNAFGPSWERLYEFLTVFGRKRLCAGDYQAFDKNMSAAVILAAFDILIDIADKSGFEEEDLIIMRAMAHDIAFPVVNMDGDLIMVYGMNPSGHPLTVIINCLVNCLYLRMAFISNNPTLQFKDHVHLATYGDDNIFGVSEDCSFSHTILADFLQSQGIVYTMADKSSVSIPFVDIDDTTFLKRSFRYDHDAKHIMAPLEVASLERSMLYGLPSAAMSAEAQAVEKLNMACLEYFHHGREKFIEERKWVISIVDKHDLWMYVKKSDFPTYELLLERFILQFNVAQDGILDKIFPRKCVMPVPISPQQARDLGQFRKAYFSALPVAYFVVYTYIFCYLINFLVYFSGYWKLQLNLFALHTFIFSFLTFANDMHPFYKLQLVFSMIIFFITVSLKNLGFGEIQCGCIEASDDEHCYLCGYGDCPMSNKSQTICPRCKHCRHWEVVEDDVWFLGCFYCETTLPLICNQCGDLTIDIRIRLDSMHNIFYCTRCYDGVNNFKTRHGKVVHEMQSNHRKWCDPFESVSTPNRLPSVQDAHSQDGIVPKDTTSTLEIRPTPLSNNRPTEYTNTQSLLGLTKNSLDMGSWDPLHIGVASSAQDGDNISTNASIIPDPTVSATDQQTTSFLDASVVPTTNIPHVGEEIPYQVANRNSQLGDFLSRPVKIANYTWSTTDTIDAYHNIAPFHLYLDNANIKYKLHNWAFIKCDLKIKIVFNASPFYYGTWMYAWQPLANTSYTSYIYSGTDEASHVPLSQLQKILICPQTSQSVEMTLPFIYPNDFVPMTDEDFLENMGYLLGRNMVPLQSANDAAGSVTLSIYAWAENVVLHGATAALAMQDGKVDEYAMDGPISKPASALANFASMLGSVPVIGPFATATSIGATAVASVAKLFGYTNTPVIDDQKAFQPRAFPFFATTDTGFPTDKLCLDPKNELSIDSRLCGLDGTDELAIAHLVQKESFLTSFEWDTSDSEDDLLWNCPVRPQLYVSDADTLFHINMTPMCWIATMFKYWRGDIIFRFKLNSSAFHRGRMRITFDPLGTAPSAPNTQMTCFNEIVDISPSSDIEIRVPYQQHRSWLQTYVATSLTETFQGYGETALGGSSGYWNGNISCRVQTQLTAPVASSAVQVMVFVRGAENLEFAMPDTQRYRNVIVGGEMQDGLVMTNSTPDLADKPKPVVLGEIIRPAEHLGLVYMGEQVCSLRVLLRRMCKSFNHRIEPGTNALSVGYIRLFRMPPRFGFPASSGLVTTKGVIDTGTTTRFNYCQPTFLSIIAPAFLGNRGAVNWSVVTMNGTAMGSRVNVIRSPALTGVAISSDSSTATTTGPQAKWYYEFLFSTGAGSMSTQTRTNAGVNFSVPFFASDKFAPNQLTAANASAYNNNITSDGFQIEYEGNSGSLPGIVDMAFHVGAGPDFNLIYFMFVPTMSVLTTLPAAV